MQSIARMADLRHRQLAHVPALLRLVGRRTQRVRLRRRLLPASDCGCHTRAIQLLLPHQAAASVGRATDKEHTLPPKAKNVLVSKTTTSCGWTSTACL